MKNKPDLVEYCKSTLPPPAKKPRISEADKAPCGNDLAGDSPENRSLLRIDLLIVAAALAVAVAFWREW